MNGLKPLNIAGGTIVVQIALIMILLLGVWLTQHRNPTTNDKHLPLSIIVVTLLLSLAVLVATRDFYGVWSPILGDLVFPTVSDSGGLVVSFCIDLIAVTLLLLYTGGAKESPFTSVLFLIPALAIFLREPPWHFFGYAGYAAVVYSFSLKVGITGRGSVGDSASGWVNLACLGLTMLTGYITRPLPL
ncbi:TPA: hypothetical protein QDC03_005602 [Burkholderia cepacia]|uniref:hypothetical protein n=1 Tax=Burkholderia cepacia TaxID=292 RepID=UPI0011B1DB0E|nr:hypothetical protein [Burkholderia cepacia]HDR9510436.1 hypothetical protein [Burkholderia cepacia]